MKFIANLFIVLFLGMISVKSQSHSFFFGQKPSVFLGDKMLKNAWAGGLNSPQISTMDVNFDALPDLVVFDRTSYKITIFVQQNNQWNHAPEYEFLFPKLEHFLLLRDYNNDGKKDIFTVTSFGISVYKNVSENHKLAWKLIANPLKSISLSELNLNLKIDVTDIPAIVDIDQDGDLDILNFIPFTGESVEFHQNFGIEKYGTSDSLVFEKVQSRFGHFSECSDCNQFIFGNEICGNGRVEHAGSSLLLLDTNGDENLDFLIGDVSCTNLIHLVTSGNTLEDTITSFATNFPPKKPANLTIFPASFYEDVTFDDVPDLLVAPNLYANEDNAVNFKQSLWLYQNNTILGTSNFDFVQDNFLQDDMLDVGESAQPVFVDEDGDGDLDMLLCHAGELNQSGTFSSHIYLFENINTPENPTFSLKEKDYLNFSAQNLQFLKIAFADLNQDKKLDFIYAGFDAENRQMKFNFVFNEGEKKLLYNLEKVQNLNVKIDAGETPLFWDVDADDDPDLLIGKYEGNLEYFENQGDMNFQRQTQTAGGIDENFYQQNLSPILVDLQQDRTPELITLDRSGILRIYPDFTTQIFDKIEPQNNLVFSKLAAKNNEFYFGKNASLGHYGTRNLAVGMGGGGVLFLDVKQGDEIPTLMTENQLDLGWKMYPNPAQNELLVESFFTQGKIVLFDVFGKEILSKNIWQRHTKIDVSKVKNGIYFVKFIAKNYPIHTKKLLIFHQN